MKDRYRSFAELETREPEGRSWTREYRPRNSRLLVMAPHGGWIEPYTSELARDIAGEELSFYTFRGVRDGANHTLHLTSHRFDEPLALEAVSRAEVVVAIHGERSRKDPFVMVGGCHEWLKRSLKEALVGEGFVVKQPRIGLSGENPRNICNRGTSGAGVQLEISEGLRGRLFREPGFRKRFVGAVRGVLLPAESRE